MTAMQARFVEALLSDDREIHPFNCHKEIVSR